MHGGWAHGGGAHVGGAHGGWVHGGGAHGGGAHVGGAHVGAPLRFKMGMIWLVAINPDFSWNIIPESIVVVQFASLNTTIRNLGHILLPSVPTKNNLGLGKFAIPKCI